MTRSSNVLCFLWITTILRIQGFVAAEADPAILSGTDLAHFQQVRKILFVFIYLLFYIDLCNFFFLCWLKLLKKGLFFL